VEVDERIVLDVSTARVSMPALDDCSATAADYTTPRHAERKQKEKPYAYRNTLL
jgi:hypothetical protein